VLPVVDLWAEDPMALFALPSLALPMICVHMVLKGIRADEDFSTINENRYMYEEGANSKHQKRTELPECDRTPVIRRYELT